MSFAIFYVLIDESSTLSQKQLLRFLFQPIDQGYKQAIPTHDDA